MSKLPQVNVRLAPEHHDLIRELAQRLRANPSLAIGLADFLAQASHDGRPQVSPSITGLAADVADLQERIGLLQPILDRLTRDEEFSRRIMAFAENINDRVKVLEQPALKG
jgi:hypothetical protein